MSLQAEERNMIETEMIKIRSLTDVLVTVDPGDLERNTLACLAVLIQEAAERMKELTKGLFRDTKFEPMRRSDP